MPEQGERFLKLTKLFLPVLRLPVQRSRPAQNGQRDNSGPHRSQRLFVQTANDPVRHYHRLDAGCVNKRQYFLRNSGIVADISARGEPAPEIRDLGMFARQNADCELGG